MEASLPLPVVGFLVDDLLSGYQLRLLRGLQRVARDNGVRLVTFCGGSIAKESKRTRFDGSFLFELAKAPQVDALIVETSLLAAGVGERAVLKLCKGTEVPIVSITSSTDHPWIEVNQQDGIQQLVEHLTLEHGCRRLAFVGGPLGNANSTIRENSFRLALERGGISLDERLVLPGTFLERSGWNAIDILETERNVDPRSLDAVVAANDLMAFGVMAALTTRGIKLPGEVRVVGFDDDDLSIHSEPSLTTVSQPVEFLAERAMKKALALLQGRNISRRSVVNASVVLRASCGCNSGGPKGAPSRAQLPFAERLKARALECSKYLKLHLGNKTNTDIVDAVVEHLLDPGEGVENIEAVLARSIRCAADSGFYPWRWLAVFAPLSQELGGAESGEKFRRSAERLRQITLSISQTSASVQAFNTNRNIQASNAIRVLGGALGALDSTARIGQVLEAALPGLGIASCSVFLFSSNAGNDFELTKKIVNYSAAMRSEIPVDRADELWSLLPETVSPLSAAVPSTLCSDLQEASDTVFQLRELPPEGTVLFPLVCRRRSLGYVAFSFPRKMGDAWLLEGLAGHLSVAISTIQNSSQLRRARRQAEVASEAKGEFVAVVSHELRTPLTAIMGQLDLSLRQTMREDLRNRLEAMNESGKSLLRIVDNVLDFSKLEAQELETEQVAFGFEVVLARVLGTCAMGASRKGIELVLDVDPSVPTVLIGDALRLSQILVNLVSNATKFTASGHVTLAVQVVDKRPDDTVVLRFSVVDTGVGMTPAQLEGVFEPFTQADGSTTRRYGGTGLGLAISQRIAKVMETEIRVSSTLGQGSTFWFSAPLVAPQEMSTTPNLLVSPACVLLIEPCAAQSQAIARTLGSRGHRVTAVKSVQEGLTHLSLSSDEHLGLVIIGESLSARKANTVAGQFRARTRAKIVFFCQCGVNEIASVSSPVSMLTKPVLPSTLLVLAESVSGSPNMPRVNGMQATAPLQGRRVLLVQDNPISRDVVAAMLSCRGAKVTCVPDGCSAVEKAVARPFDIVLMDLHLPDISGYEATSQIREKGKNLPIVALTAGGSSLQKCLDSGLNDMLVTPLSSEELTLAIGTILERVNVACQSSVQPAEQESAVEAPLPVLDWERGVELVGGSRSLHLRLVARFLERYDKEEKRISDLVAKDNKDAAAQIVHGVVSAAGNIGAFEVCKRAGELEAALLSEPGNCSTALRRFCASLSAMCEAASAVVHSEEEEEQELITLVCPDVDSRTSVKEVVTVEMMRNLLLEHDTSALDYLPDICSLLEPELPRTDLKQFEDRVRAYDFEQAFRYIEKLVV